MEKDEQIAIEIYSDIYQVQVQDLILKIQQSEFQIDIDLLRQPDLQQIKSFYQTGLGNFWVAINNNKVIGTISLLDIGNKQVALRKMFVDINFRGKAHKVGQRLLGKALEYSKKNGVEDIFLGTTAKFTAAQKFYEKNGFIEIAKELLPIQFPVMIVDVKFYHLKLKN
jgi:N-acetylglutamate synthase-like GNAT family acetyltransferase